MTRLPHRPALDWPDPATPRSADSDDVYFSGDGLAEKRAVFLDGCGLPAAWAERESFTIGELGFGTGLACLAAWDLWRRRRPSASARLHLLSFEGAPISAADAARVHAAWPELADLSRRLVACWPDRARGVQRIAFDDGVTLTLCVDDIAAALPQASASVDAWFLDGFAPSKNPTMWTHETLRHVARLSAPGARLATYTVAGDVRRGLEAVGFTVEKRPGVGRKKERLEARLARDAAARPSPPASILIVGAGVAGAACARAFLTRGCKVAVVDGAPAPGAGASGNALALVMPRLDAVDGPTARALLAAWLFARRYWLALGTEAATGLDVIQWARTDRDRSRHARLLADPPLEPALLSALEAADGSGGLAGLRHRGAAAVRPETALPALLAGARLRLSTRMASLGWRDGRPFGVTAAGETLTADRIVVCAGPGASDIAGLACPPLDRRLGQIECAAVPAADCPVPASAVADGGYVVEAFGDVVFGATFEAAVEPAVTDAARAFNRAVLSRLRPDLLPLASSARSRAAIRAATRDHLPFAGPAAARGGDEPLPGVDLVGGLGSRGYLWAPLLAEIVASAAFGEPAPAECSSVALLDPDRFRRRDLRRR